MYYIVRIAGLVSVTFVMYNLTHLTREELFQLPLLIYILCGAVFIELFFHPVKKFINMSQTLGRGRFLWALRVGAALLLFQSTQSCEVSIVLLTITCVIHVLLLQKKMLNSRRHRKLSSQELENVTVTNNSYS